MISWDENFDEYLSAIGLNKFCIFLTKNSCITTQINKIDENQYELKVKTMFASITQTFTPGKEKEVPKYIDGRRFKNVFEFDGNRLIEKQIEKNNCETTIIREFYENEMIGTIIYGDIKTKQKNIYENKI